MMMAENRHFLITVTIILIRTKKKANFKGFNKKNLAILANSEVESKLYRYATPKCNTLQRYKKSPLPTKDEGEFCSNWSKPPTRSGCDGGQGWCEMEAPSHLPLQAQRQVGGHRQGRRT